MALAITAGALGRMALHGTMWALQFSLACAPLMLARSLLGSAIPVHRTNIPFWIPRGVVPLHKVREL